MLSRFPKNRRRLRRIRSGSGNPVRWTLRVARRYLYNIILYDIIIYNMFYGKNSKLKAMWISWFRNNNMGGGYFFRRDTMWHVIATTRVILYFHCKRSRRDFISIHFDFFFSSQPLSGFWEYMRIYSIQLRDIFPWSII